MNFKFRERKKNSGEKKSRTERKIFPWTIISSDKLKDDESGEKYDPETRSIKIKSERRVIKKTFLYTAYELEKEENVCMIG